MWGHQVSSGVPGGFPLCQEVTVTLLGSQPSFLPLVYFVFQAVQVRKGRGSRGAGGGRLPALPLWELACVCSAAGESKRRKNQSSSRRQNVHGGEITIVTMREAELRYPEGSLGAEVDPNAQSSSAVPGWSLGTWWHRRAAGDGLILRTHVCVCTGKSPSSLHTEASLPRLLESCQPTFPLPCPGLSPPEPGGTPFAKPRGPRGQMGRGQAQGWGALLAVGGLAPAAEEGASALCVLLRAHLCGA